MPVTVVMNYNDGVYAIDSDSGNSGVGEKNILTWMVCRHPYLLVLKVFIFPS
jgi:hypothetical protein